MKIKLAILVAVLGVYAAGAAQAASVTKTIRLSVQIGDAIFASPPGGAGGYENVELEASDRGRTAFSKILPLRMAGKGAGFHVSLMQPLRMRGGAYEMREPKVFLLQAGRETEIKVGAPLRVGLGKSDGADFEHVHQLKISARAPVRAANGPDTNGAYHGALLVLFEASPAAR